MNVLREIYNTWNTSKQMELQSMATHQSKRLVPHTLLIMMSAAKEVATSWNLKASWVAAPLSKVLQTLQHITLMQELEFAVLKQFRTTHISSAQESKHARFLTKSHTARNSTIQTLCHRIVATLLQKNIRRMPSPSMTLRNSVSNRLALDFTQKFNLTSQGMMEMVNALW